ncbi:MAG: hypothetical protein H0Z28_10045 [Archaeoglobus sp.]|nr:hypothetical protein [Archaeoglobus sp.]
MSSEAKVEANVKIPEEEPNYVIIRLRDKGKDKNNIPFTMRFNLAKLINENRLSISRTGGHYFLIIDSYEIGLPLSALKEIIGLALMMMPPEHAEQVFKEWYDVVC